MSEGRIDTIIDGNIGWLVINHPAKHNALTSAMFASLPDAVDSLGTDDRVRVVVVRGAGEAAFVSGADIAGLRSAEPSTPQDEARSGIGALAALAKPVVAMIRGWCLGGGVMMAMAADIRLAGDDATFGIPAARLGIGYPPAEVARLVSLVGPAHAADLLSTARRFDADEAARLGLVNRVVAASELEAETRGVAQAIAGNGPLAIASHKLSIRAAVSGRDEDRSAAAAAAAATMGSADFAEGRAAFFERRPPRFSGT